MYSHTRGGWYGLGELHFTTIHVILQDKAASEVSTYLQSREYSGANRLELRVLGSPYQLRS